MSDQNENTVLETFDRFGDDVQVSLTTYKGKQYLDCRVWYPGDDDKFRPTKKGIMFKPEELEALIGALQRAQVELNPVVEEQAA